MVAGVEKSESFHPDLLGVEVNEQDSTNKIAHDHEQPSPAKFITVDSAWHTYHVRLEESVKNLEEGQAETLRPSQNTYTENPRIDQVPRRYLRRLGASNLHISNPC